ncbi:MAG: ATP-binding cassette domain-containing protein [Elusimicrobiota bacterium]|jgi:zinc transport system ATP-binding protein|nr:ATP-binding cassette domain-containing protein [Elusimicrobiota bacterium]
MALIKCGGASFEFDLRLVLKDINFEVLQGDYICIVGDNGSGKTTLLKGLLKIKRPCKGEIVFGDGLELSDIGYLPQSAIVQKDFPASVNEVVLSGRLNSRGLMPFYRKIDREIADENMELLSVINLKRKCFRELSGGQQQRVLLARALCAAKRLLVLDEPVAGLDPLALNELYKIIKDINEKKGIAVVMVSHDIKNAVRDASRILQVQTRQVFWGKAQDYINSYEGKRLMQVLKDENGGVNV